MSDPPRTPHAVLLIDLQKGFCSAEGSLAPDGAALERYRQVVAQAALLAEAARVREMLVVYLRHVFRPGYPEAHETMPFLARLRASNALLEGSTDTELMDSLAVRGNELLIDKSRFDAFLDTGLDGILRARGVRRIAVAGVSTNVCVESSVRSGAERGYDMYVASDATAATDEELHRAALRSMSYAFATVAPWRDFVRYA